MKVSTAIACLMLPLLIGCKDPQNEYFKQIELNGYIPFKQPVENVRTGSILRGTPNQLVPMAPPTSCFPDQLNGQQTQLRWESDVALAQTHFNSRLAFNAQINTIANMGTPLINFKFDVTQVTNIDFEVEGVSAELVDHFMLEDFYHNGMTDRCKDTVLKLPFVIGALQAKRMSFVFLDVFDGKISLDASKVQQIVDIKIGVNWHIENGYKLVITTPKFIGYHLAQLREKDNGMVNLVSYEADFKDNEFRWTDLIGPEIY